MVASHWLGTKPEDVTDTYRDRTKRIVYGILYGMGSATLSNILKVTREEAAKFIQGFLGKFPNVKKFMDATVADAKRTQTIRTLKGRLRRLADITSTTSSFANRALRQAVNSVIQGSAADIIKSAMIKMDKYLIEGQSIKRGDARLVLQIHDELVYEVKDECVDDMVQAVQEIMTNCVNLDVPLTISMRVGKQWGSLEAVNLSNSFVEDENDEFLEKVKFLAAGGDVGGVPGGEDLESESENVKTGSDGEEEREEEKEKIENESESDGSN